LLIFYFIIWKVNSLKAFVTLLTLEKYVNGTMIQWNRIQADKRALPGIGESNKYESSKMYLL
jgi:hypothetical protein